MGEQTRTKKWTCPVCRTPNVIIKGREPKCIRCGFVIEKFGKKVFPEAKRASNKWVITTFIGVIILIAAIVVVCIVKLNLIANSPSGVVLKTSDLPAGWEENGEWGQGGGQWEGMSIESAFVRTFTRATPTGSSTITSTAVKFKLSAAASSFYNQTKQLYSSTGADHQRIGDKSYISTDGHVGFFVKKEFFVQLETTGENTVDIAQYLRISERRTYWPYS